MTDEIQNEESRNETAPKASKPGRKPKASKPEEQAPQEQLSGRTISVAIRSMPQGDTQVYACSGFHLADEHKQFLPFGQKKILPGDVVELPAEVAKRYLTSRMLEIVQ